MGCFDLSGTLLGGETIQEKVVFYYSGNTVCMRPNLEITKRAFYYGGVPMAGFGQKGSTLITHYCYNLMWTHRKNFDFRGQYPEIITEIQLYGKWSINRKIGLKGKGQLGRYKNKF